MAATHTLYCQAISFAADKNMSAILNGGSNILKIMRVGLLNTQTVAVTGVVCQMEIQKLEATASFSSAPTSVTPVKHDTNSSALSSVTSGHSGTIGTTGSTISLKRFLWSSDEPSTSSATSDEWECFVPINIAWDLGYGDANLQPLTVRTDEAFRLYNISGAAGLLDSWVEFTDEAP